MNVMSVLTMCTNWDTELSVVLTPVNLLYMSSSRGRVWCNTPQQVWSDPWVRARRRRQEGPNKRRSSSTKWRLLSEEKEGTVTTNNYFFLHILYSIVLWVSIMHACTVYSIEYLWYLAWPLWWKHQHLNFQLIGQATKEEHHENNTQSIDRLQRRIPMLLIMPTIMCSLLIASLQKETIIKIKYNHANNFVWVYIHCKRNPRNSLTSFPMNKDDSTESSLLI